ncbi:MAG: hypothetical protein PHG65_10800, partial [Kiritimatiellae bacterium]|nr:hypothetical protein [Kiritimatiellia bacterium]
FFLAFFFMLLVRAASWKRLVLALAASSVFLAAAELLQPFFGRECSWGDWFLGLAGVGLAGLAFLMRRTASNPRGVIALAWLLVCSVSLVPLLYALNDSFAREKAFPELASFETEAELGRWALNGVELTRVEIPVRGPGCFAGRVSFTNDSIEYPGLFMTEITGNWTNAEALILEVYWPGSVGTNLEFRLDDLPGNPPYAERFQASLSLVPGWNELRLSLADMEVTPSGRRLRFDKVRCFGLFFQRAEANEYLVLDNIRLTLR